MKIRGNVVGTNMKPEKNLVKATGLTSAEQAKTRDNIGAGAKPLVFLYDEQIGRWRLPVDFKGFEDCFYKDRKRSVFIVNEEEKYSCIVDKIVRGETEAQDGYYDLYSAVGVFRFDDGENFVKISEPETGGGANTLIVTINENDEPSHAADQIYALVRSGGTVALAIDGRIIPLNHSEDECAYFVLQDDTATKVVYEINDDQFYTYEDDLITRRFFDGEIGNISSALDSIIAIQNELLGIIFTFTVEGDGHVYTAEKVMDWYAWVESEYNTTGFYVDGHRVYHSSDDPLGINGEYIEPPDSIIADAVYERL